MSEVIQFKAPPKRVSNTYKGWNYVVVYLPATKEWEWTITKTSELRHQDTAKSLKDAVKALQQFIDGI